LRHTPTLAPEPTDDEIFADLPDELPIDAAVVPARRRAAEPEVTRVADPDAALLAELSEEDDDGLLDFDGEPEPTRVGSPGQELLERVARDDAGPRLAATVRREDLERLRNDGDGAALRMPGGEAMRMAPGQIL